MSKEEKEVFPITVIIPTRPGESVVPAAEAALRLDYPRELLEILVVRGTHPSCQRNLALRQAKGELIYFLDDDSLPEPNVLQIGVKYFHNSKVKIVGGPNLCPPNAPRLEKLFALTMGSWIAFGPSRVRYLRTGKPRTSSEKELILCNMLVSRQTLLDHGGFDEALYPNEENALMDDILKEGGNLIYDPDFFVYRRPRRTLGAFCRMLITYGRGRAEQFRLHPGPGSLLNFIPPLFFLFTVATPFLPWWITAPVWGFYFLTLLIQSWISGHGFKGISLLPLLFLTHLCYGLGFWLGLFTSPRSLSENEVKEIKIEKIL